MLYLASEVRLHGVLNPVTDAGDAERCLRGRDGDAEGAARGVERDDMRAGAEASTVDEARRGEAGAGASGPSDRRREDMVGSGNEEALRERPRSHPRVSH